MTTDKAVAIAPNVQAALQQLKAGLEQLYGSRLNRIVLFGSRARGDSREDSDVDIAIVLNGPYSSLMN